MFKPEKYAISLSPIDSLFGSNRHIKSILLLCTIFYYVLIPYISVHTFSHFFTLDPLFRTVSRGSPGPRGLPGPPVSFLRKFIKCLGN